jgi:hypothetical protein
VRIPILGLWDGGARFQDDASIGNGASAFKFNEGALRVLCDALEVSEYAITRLQKSGLASEVLNDLLATGLRQQGKIYNSELVVDEELTQVVGLVSHKYLGLSNDAFVRDILICLDPSNDGSLLPTLSDYDFIEGYSVNTRLFIRLASRKTRGVVRGPAGVGEDVSLIGFQASNAMAGGHAVRLSHFVRRLICANGLTLPVASGSSRIIHSGTEANFRRKLEQGTREVAGAAAKAKALVETLGGLVFEPEKLARIDNPDLIFDVIPDRDLRTETTHRLPARDYRGLPDGEKRLLKIADMIRLIPACLGGQEALAVFRSPFRTDASMFDFVNVYTEHAKSLTPSKKIEAESRAGNLATWIKTHKRKFL